MPRNTSASSPAPAASHPLTLFARLRKLVASRAQTPAQLEEAIAELAQAHAASAAHARDKRLAHQRTLLDLLASADEGQLEQSRAAAAAASAHEAELAAALDSLRERLAQLRAEQARHALDERWQHAQSLMQERRHAIAALQACADAYARALEHAVQASEAVWAALPEHPPHRPATYGRDLYARAAAYLYGATDGKSNGPGVGGSAAHLARKRADLVTLDASARGILLLPLSASQAREALQRAARPAQPANRNTDHRPEAA
jgi:DNA repair exonuclease SbcCD ATPase subunit